MLNHEDFNILNVTKLSSKQFKTEAKNKSYSEKMSTAARIIQSEFYYLDEASIIGALNDIYMFDKCPSVEDFVSQWYSSCNFDIAA
jgi:hypothetical protein